jgi:hypothetical protein
MARRIRRNAVDPRMVTVISLGAFILRSERVGGETLEAIAALRWARRLDDPVWASFSVSG